MADKKQPIDKEYLLNSLRNFDNSVLSKKYLQSSTTQLHVHTNKNILDKITVADNGVLLFDGNEINSSSGNGQSVSNINQITFQNILKDEQKEVDINTDLIGKLILQAYKFINGNQNVESTLKIFNSENSKFFNYNAENICFGNLGVKICDSYQLEFDSYSDDLYISQPFNSDDFVSLKGEVQAANLYSDSSQKLKPDSTVLIGSGKEMSDYEIKEYSLSGCGNPYGLFDGNRSNNFNTKDVCYWQSTDHYLTITFMQPVNIYRSGTYNWKGHCAKFKILKLNEETEIYTDITSTVAQTTSEINNDQWELTIEGLPAGTYKFVCTGYRIDSEWFLEKSKSSYLLKHDDITYCISEEYYDSETGAYIPFDNSIDFTNIFCDSLFDYADYLNGLRPIDKFFGDVQIIKKNSEKFVIQGIKSSSELIVSNEDIDKEIAETINNLSLIHEKSGEADIKMAFSFDSGTTWNTFNGDVFERLNIDIPSEQFNEFSSNQKKQWENAKNVILNNGVGMYDCDNADFQLSLMNAFVNNDVVKNTIRFAYVLKQPTYNGKCSISELKWNYNEQGYFSLMIPNTEYIFLVYRNKIIFKSLINSDLIKVNILS